MERQRMKRCRGKGGGLKRETMKGRKEREREMGGELCVFIVP